MLQRNQLDKTTYHQKYFRPSCWPALNLRFETSSFLDPYIEKNHDQFQLPTEWTKTPEDTVLNYFSILREAENMAGRSCGTVGHARTPFPLAYNFLSEQYQRKLSYEDYFHSFAGVGHTSLIKLFSVPDIKYGIRFFYEIETIEGFEGKKREYFGYYYGFIQLVHEKEGYRISDMSKMEEDFLCAPYHGWSHDAESVVEVKYGGWCKLVQKRYPTVTNGYVKNIYFKGKDGADYYLVFFALTNGTDVEIAQFRKVGNEEWKQVDIKPEEECLTEKRD
ncbi:hypothetical protein [Neobacillus rhizophilus]|uniref:Uncharacterized protein n=1 Tax=Neobacillus rhizophilus TaxID=2833579 RepID=A0A942U4Q4_9BACI|nr:hypothetical protein [Neobacillus rhizophilus]MBS4212827.1 hypothetical protein [Neobacillus rhizophilus]